MYDVKEVIIVEGNYDKIKLSGFIESPIFVTNGFGVFNNKGRAEAIKTFAKTTGIVILTDSDSAGLKIRAYIKQLVKEGKVLDAFVPEVLGKERRKKIGAKEGLLGVEGISQEVIMEALKKSGATICGVAEEKRSSRQVTKADLYALGLSGRENSELLRKKLLKELCLPTKLSANTLAKTLDRLLTFEELAQLVEKIKQV